MRVRLHRAVKMFKMRTEYRTFAAWKEVYRKQKHYMVIMRRTVERLRRRNLARAMTRWNEVREERIFARSFLHRMIARVTRAELFRAWRTMREHDIQMKHAIQRKNSKVLSEQENMRRRLAEAEERVKKGQMRAVVKRLLERQMTCGWNAWRAFIEHRRRIDAMIKR